MNWDRVLQIDLIPWNIGHEVRMLLLYMMVEGGRRAIAMRDWNCTADKNR